MDRLHALYQHWSWLPHFRAIAETQNLGAAARMLRITPPALSRALGHLEAALGTKLFERHGRRLVLNSAGVALRGAMRTAMRHIDDAVTAVAATRQDVEIKIAAPGPYFGAVVLPALVRVHTQWPELNGELVDMPSSVVVSLTSGEIDVCLHEHAIASADVISEPIYKLQKVVCCAPTHMAARRRRLVARDLGAYEFVAPPATAEGVRNDGWQVDLERRVGLTVANMQLGVDAAKTGRYLALLPRPIAIGNGLMPLQISGLSIAVTSIYASWRRPLSTTSDVIGRVVRILRAELARLDKQR
jgi:LysR family glycine cleavage system transcriptional activator